MGGGTSKGSPAPAPLDSSLVAKKANEDPAFKAEILKALDVPTTPRGTAPAPAALAPASSRVSLMPQAAELAQQGEGNTTSFRLQASKDGRPLSLWHDVPLYATDKQGNKTNFVHFVCEIPKWTRKKFEIDTTAVGTPIKQDTKNEVLREFKTGAAGVMINYGCLPQTWEDPKFVHPDAGVGGDNDPLDACEIGMRQIKSGEVRPVKILGILCMIDEGEADWKLLVIDVDDPWAAMLNDISDVDEKIPGLTSTLREWFRNYKVADGKPQNKFGLDEKWMDAQYATSIVEETNHAWKEIICGQKETTLNTTGRVSMMNLHGHPDEMAKMALAASSIPESIEEE